MATHLELVNSVLLRLRESSVATVNATAYSSLISRYLNDTKRQVEDSFTWDALQTEITFSTVGNQSTYTVTGSGRRFKDVEVHDTTNLSILGNVPMPWITRQQQISTVQTGNPIKYAWNGTDGTDSKIELYPTPNGIFSITVNLCVPQADLVADGDVLTIHAEPVILGAYARAVAERGEDGGFNSSEVYQLFKSSLSDHIAIEASRQCEYDSWVVC